MCEYVFRNGAKCQEPAIEGSPFCVLHTPLPEDADSEEFRQLRRLKEEKAQEKVDAGDFNFEGARFDSFRIPIRTEGEVNFNDARFREDARFGDAAIGGDAWFEGVYIGGRARFEGVNIGGNARFDGAEIDGDFWFYDARIDGYAWFSQAKFDGHADLSHTEIHRHAWFDGTGIGGNAWFDDTKIVGTIYFNGTKIKGDAWFYGAKIGKGAVYSNIEIDGAAWFSNAEISGIAWFDGAKIGGNAHFRDANIDDIIFKSASFSGIVSIIPIHVNGNIIFKDCRFSDPQAQEEACRVAKNQCIKFGDNHEADHYFYREMEGKRRQKLEIFRWPEFIFVQGIFGYGVKPFRTFCIWLGVILSFALIFSNVHALDSGSNFIEYFYFSTTNAMTPGYGGYTVLPEWQWLALIEAFFGTFMWAAFITIFARKYMR